MLFDKVVMDRIPPEAHWRIEDALEAADLIVLRTKERCEAGFHAAAGNLLSPSEFMKPGGLWTIRQGKRITFEDYCSSGDPAVQLNAAGLEAARALLHPVAIELAAVFSGFECRKILPKQLDFAAGRYRLTETQKQILWAELKRDPGFDGITKTAAPREVDQLAEDRSEPRFVDEAHRYHTQLFEKIRKTTSVDKWVREHKSLGRTSVMDYLAGRVKGKVSSEKRKEIEAAISESAQGRFSSDI